MFEVARQLSPAGIWSTVHSLIYSQTLPFRSAAALGPIVLAAILVAGALARTRRLSLALTVATVAVVAGCLIVLDRTPLSVLPGPDFNPGVILR